MNSDKNEHPIAHPNPNWRVVHAARRSACDNRPGLKNMYVKVLDKEGIPLAGAKVRFDTHPSVGMVYDHPNWWGLTNEAGYIEWNHLGIPTRYMLYMDEDGMPLVTNIRTDLGNEYCRPPGSPWWSGRRPVNRPGVYSYDILIQRRY